MYIVIVSFTHNLMDELRDITTHTTVVGFAF